MKMTWCGSWLAICDICHENQRIIGLEVDRMVIRNIVYIAYNLFCLPRNKLATKLVINFVTVIFFRVVASRYYNTCQCIPKLHRKTQLRRRTCVGMEINTNSHSTQNICCHSRKELTIISSIITNYQDLNGPSIHSEFSHCSLLADMLLQMYVAAHVDGQQELELALSILVSSCNSSAVQPA